MTAAGMDLQTLEKKLTAEKDEAFQAWIDKAPLRYGRYYKEAWEKAEGRYSDFWRQMGPASVQTPGGEHAGAGLL